MWARGLHSYAMVSAPLSKGCENLGRIPSLVKFLNETQLKDGSYLSFINPHAYSEKKDLNPYKSELSSTRLKT
jgi:hypothetical protein